MTTAPRPVHAVDYHTAGEPFRIVRDGLPPIPGDSVAERCATAIGPGGSGTAPRRGALDDVRRLLVREPRGHAGMYGGFVVPPDDDGAHFGVLFWHKDGYSTACGHGAMALGAWAVDSGLVPAPDTGDAHVRIDVPSGRVAVTVHREAGRTTGITFRNVPARIGARKVPVATTLGPVEVDLAHAGACYASVRAGDLGLDVSRAALPELVRAGREIRAALATHPGTWHPDGPLLSGVYGVILHEELPDTPEGRTSATSPSSPTGRSTARPADPGPRPGSHCWPRTVGWARGGTAARIGAGNAVHRPARARDRPDAPVTEVTGTAHRTGEHTFTVDPHDDLGTGFLL